MSCPECGFEADACGLDGCPGTSAANRSFAERCHPPEPDESPAAIPRIGERLALTEAKLGRLLMRLELLSKIEGPDARPGPSELRLTREIIELVRDA